MQKRGISTIIVTVILVALVLIAVGVVWAVVSNLLLESKEDISLERLTIDANINDVTTNESANNISVLAKRNPGGGSLMGFKFLFKNLTDAELHTINTTMNELEEKVFTFHLNMNVSEVLTITIIPLIQSGDKLIFGTGRAYTIMGESSIPTGGAPTQTCGNNIKEGTEICDGTDLGGEDCINQAFVSGTLSCNLSCSGFNTGECYSNHGINLSDGFSTASAGASWIYGITFDTRDNSFWIVDSIDNFIYHFNSLGINQTDGFGTYIAGSTSQNSITFDPRDNSFWIIDGFDAFVYHFNSLGINQTDGFKIGSAGIGSPHGITFDTRDNSFWIVDSIDNFIYHFNSLGINQTDGFSTVSAGAYDSRSIIFDSTDNSFWINDIVDDFVYHFNSTGDNQTDGFTIKDEGSNYAFGVTLNTRDNTFWISDGGFSGDDFVYHFS